MKSYETRKLNRAPVHDDCDRKWRSLSLNAWIIILIITCIVIFHVQIFFLFGGSSEDDSDIPECLPQVEVNFADNFTSIELSERLFREWMRSSEQEDRLLYNRRQDKDFLTVILPMHASDGLTALTSYVNHSTLYEKLHNSILVILLGSDAKLLDKLVHKIINLFHSEIDIGFILLVQPRMSFFTSRTSDLNKIEIPFFNLTSNNILRVTTKWLDYVSSFVHVSSQYCILADARYEAVHRFLTLAKERLKKQNKRLLNWSLLELAGYDNIDDEEDDNTVEHINGWLLRSEDIFKLSYFLRRISLLDVTVIEIINLFRLVVSQKGRIVIQPPLFRPVGISEALHAEGFSSSKRWKGDDPQATVITNMNPVRQHGVDFIYSRDYGYFRAQSPQVGDWIGIVFDRDDVSLIRVGIETGNNLGEFTLRAGIIEASPRLLKLDVNQRILTCADFVPVGSITREQRWIEFDKLDKKLWGRNTKCLRLMITEIESPNGIENPTVSLSELKESSEGALKFSDVIFAQIAVFT